MKPRDGTARRAGARAAALRDAWVGTTCLYLAALVLLFQRPDLLQSSPPVVLVREVPVWIRASPLRPADRPRAGTAETRARGAPTGRGPAAESTERADIPVAAEVESAPDSTSLRGDTLGSGLAGAAGGAGGTDSVGTDGLGGVVELPELEAVHMIPPRAPGKVDRPRTVLVAVTVARDGAVHQAQIAQSCGDERFDRAALEAARGWRFRWPRGLAADSVRTRLPFEFGRPKRR